MIILAVDTTAKAVSVCVVADGKVLSSLYANTGLTHSQTLMPMIDFALKNALITIKDVDFFAVNNCPGSFTGVRIGVATVKALAQAGNKPCIEVSTLEALAYNISFFDGTVVCAMDARCNQVYTASFFSRGTEVERLTPDDAMLVSELEELLKKAKKPVIFVGDGAMLCYEYYKEKIPSLLAGEGQRYENAVSTGLAAYNKALKNDTVSYSELMPKYLRLPQAERELKKKEKLS